MAATFYGSVTPTFDVDITPEMTTANLSRLSSALTELDARVRVEGIPDGLSFSPDATSLMGITTLNVVTKFGPLDCDDPDLIGGPGSRWARRHLYRLGDDSAVPPEVTAYTIWIAAPGHRWWLTWSLDPQQAGRLLIYSLAPAPGD